VKKRMKAILAGRGAPAEPAAPLEGPNPVAEPFAIGDLRLANRLVQAPLAGIANWAFRRQSRRHGAGLTVSEMVSSFAVHHGNEKTLRMLRIVADEHPVGVQVFGSHADVMADAARAAEAAGADLVDINMGCPVSKVCKTGAGAAMLDDPDAAARVIEAMARAVSIPVTAKMRRGMTPATSRPAETARRLESAGAAAICLHPRAAAEEYGGTADHRITAEVVAAVSVPVIASGDIDSPAAARRVMEQTGCAAVAIGRAALGNPWVFGEILSGVPRHRPTIDEVVEEVERFAADLREAVGADRAGVDIRKFYPWYLAGLDVPKEEIDALLVAPGLDAALGRLRALRAAPLAA
jgi:nifR3 family TIM-barrel protein